MKSNGTTPEPLDGTLEMLEERRLSGKSRQTHVTRSGRFISSPPEVSISFRKQTTSLDAPSTTVPMPMPLAYSRRECAEVLVCLQFSGEGTGGLRLLLRVNTLFLQDRDLFC